MAGCDWIGVAHAAGEVRIIEHKQAYGSMLYSSRSQQDRSPTLVAFVGGREKTAALRKLQKRTQDPTPGLHGKIRVCSDSDTRRKDLEITYLDCELHKASSQVPSNSSDLQVQRRLLWMTPGRGFARQLKSLGYAIYATVLAPFLSVICLFAEDLGGMTGVAETLAEQIVDCPAPDTPRSVLPRVIVFVTSPSSTKETDEALLGKILLAVGKRKNFQSDEEARFAIFGAFNKIETVNVKTASPVTDHLLRTRVLLLAQDAQQARISRQRLFSLGHLEAFVGAALDQFSSDPKRPVRLIELSRSYGLPVLDFAGHLRELFAKAPSDAFLWCVAAPLVASALILDSSPPGMHRELLLRAACSS